MNSIVPLLLSILILGCTLEGKNSQEVRSTTDFTPSQEFKDYWFDGKGELNSYLLEQSRYGEIHKGELVLIFVTEPFSKSKQVKIDNLQAADNDAISVLKLNHSRKFLTGLYPYSILSSTFTPINQGQYPHTLKATNTVQEWCGNTFTQLNYSNFKYKLQLFSYFESEGDQNETIEGAILEEELLSLLRLNPSLIQSGQQNLIPALHYTRLAHKAIKPYQASINNDTENGLLTIKYESLRREVNIKYNYSFPYTIQEWNEKYPAMNGQMMETKASLLKSERLPYWSLNSKSDTIVRKRLLLN